MPMPESSTSIFTALWSALHRSRTVPSSAVNLMAFESTLLNTWWSRFGSASIGGRSGSISWRTMMRFASADGPMPATIVSSTCEIDTGTRSISSLPVMMRDTSRMSSMSWAWSRALRPMTSIACFARAADNSPA